MARVVDIAEAVRVVVQAAWPALTVVRSYRQVTRLEDVPQDKFLIFVAPASSESERASRIHWSHDVSVWIVIQRKIPRSEGVLSQADFDAAIAAIEVTQSALEASPVLMSGDSAIGQLLTIGNEPIYRAEHIDKQDVFTSVLTATYRRGG